MDGGRWAVGGGRWTVDGGRWTVNGGRWTVDGGRFIPGDRMWAVDGEPFDSRGCAASAMQPCIFTMPDDITNSKWHHHHRMTSFIPFLPATQYFLDPEKLTSRRAACQFHPPLSQPTSPSDTHNSVGRRRTATQCDPKQPLLQRTL